MIGSRKPTRKEDVDRFEFEILINEGTGRSFFVDGVDFSEYQSYSSSIKASGQYPLSSMRKRLEEAFIIEESSRGVVTNTVRGPAHRERLGRTIERLRVRFRHPEPNRIFEAERTQVFPYIVTVTLEMTRRRQHEF